MSERCLTTVSGEEKEEPSVIVLFAIWIEHEIVVLPERLSVSRTP